LLVAAGYLALAAKGTGARETASEALEKAGVR